jgi:hypothetical protein
MDSTHESFFSGLEPRPAAEIAQALRQLPPNDPDVIELVIGALGALALEVARMTPQVIDHDHMAAQVAAHNAGNMPAYNSDGDRLRLVMMGLGELRAMLEYGRSMALTEADLQAVVVAAVARLDAMIAAHQAAHCPD